MTLSLNELRERIKDASASLADEADGVLGTEADDLRAEIIEAADALVARVEQAERERDTLEVAIAEYAEATGIVIHSWPDDSREKTRQSLYADVKWLRGTLDAQADSINAHLDTIRAADLRADRLEKALRETNDLLRPIYAGPDATGSYLQQAKNVARAALAQDATLSEDCDGPERDELWAALAALEGEQA